MQHLSVRYKDLPAKLEPPLALLHGTCAILVKWSSKVSAQCGIALTPSFFKQHQPTQSALTQDAAESADQLGQYSMVKRALFLCKDLSD